MADRRGLIELGSERLEAFSDAVFAVIITIMALELRAPQGPTLADVGHDLLPGLIAYALSFTLVGSTGTTTTISSVPRIGSVEPSCGRTCSSCSGSR